MSNEATYNGTPCAPGIDNEPGSCCCGLMALMEKPNPTNPPGDATSAECGRCGGKWAVVDGEWRQTTPPNMTSEQLTQARKHGRNWEQNILKTAMEIDQ